MEADSAHPCRPEQKYTPQLTKTRMCKFFGAGLCKRGASCSFAHSRREVQDRPDLTRTSLCETYLQTGRCDQPNCKFAHGKQELRSTTGFFKARVCRFSAGRTCPKGSLCRFAHTGDGLRDSRGRAGVDQEVDGAGSSADERRSPEIVQHIGARQGQAGCVGAYDRFSPRPTASESVTPGPWNSVFRTAADAQDDLQRAAIGVPLDPQAIPLQDTRPMQGGTGCAQQLLPQQQRPQQLQTVGVPVGLVAQQQDFRQQLLNHQQGYPQEQLQQQQPPMQSHRSQQCQWEPSPTRADGPSGITTLTLTGLPEFLTQGALVDLLEEQTKWLSEHLDFVHCPWNMSTSKNMGHAVINFDTHEAAVQFARRWEGQALVQGGLPLQVQPAPHQGRLANMQQLCGSSAMQLADPRSWPLGRTSPSEPLKLLDISSAQCQAVAVPVGALDVPGTGLSGRQAWPCGPFHGAADTEQQGSLCGHGQGSAAARLPDCGGRAAPMGALAGCSACVGVPVAASASAAAPYAACCPPGVVSVCLVPVLQNRPCQQPVLVSAGCLQPGCSPQQPGDGWQYTVECGQACGPQRGCAPWPAQMQPQALCGQPASGAPTPCLATRSPGALAAGSISVVFPA